MRLLAEHFARTFAAEQRKLVTGFTAEAERRVLAHTWPGNVRELQNVILQAVVLTDGDRLDVADLALPAIATSDGVPPATGVLTPAALAPPAAQSQPGDAAAGHTPAWDALRDRLDAEVVAAVNAEPRPSWPLGRWLAADLTLAAHEAAAGARARAAQRVGVPHSTYVSAGWPRRRPSARSPPGRRRGRP